MPFTQLRRRLIANPNSAPGAPDGFVAIVDWYDPATRRPLTIQQDSPANDPAELATGTQVDEFEYAPGKSHRVLYDGNGSVYTTPGLGSVPCTLQAFVSASMVYTSTASAQDACVDVSGDLGVPPFQVQITNGLLTLSGVSPSAYYPYRFYNLGIGTWTATVTDARNCTATKTFEVQAGLGQPAGFELRNDYDGDPQTGTGTRFVWLYNDHLVAQYDYTGGGSGDINGDHYQALYGRQVDAYLLPDGVTWRKVFSDGAPAFPVAPGVYFEDEATGKLGTLTLDNLILFHPDTVAEPGGAVVEVLATAGPVTFTIPGHGSNQTGRFSGLLAGAYTCTVRDASGVTLAVPFELKLRYGKRWYLEYQEVGSSTLFRVELWLAGYTGAAEHLNGGASPVVLTSDGLNTSLGGQGDVPSVVGTSLELWFKGPADLFTAIEVGTDRVCRVDFYRNNQLEFRGYVQPAADTTPLLPGDQDLRLTATDGLAALKDTYFTGHVGQRLIGHRPVLHTLLHCLSRCDVSLPLSLFTNRRDLAMADTEAPELAATTNRTGYWLVDKNEPERQRPVLDALAQLLGGTLCQRAGRWEVRSLQEAMRATPGRRYQPAGTSQPDLTITAPAGAIRPPTAVGWAWLKERQGKQTRPGWKSLAGATDSGWLANAYVAGTVFSDPYAWLPDASRLRALAGWRPALPQPFTLVLVQVGDKGDSYATIWPRANTMEVRSDQALDGPPLPLAAGGEGVPAYLTFSAKLVPTTVLDIASRPPTADFADKAFLAYELLVDGRSVNGVQIAEIPRAENGGTSDSQVTMQLPLLAPGSQQATLRVYAWYAPRSLAIQGVLDYDPAAPRQVGDVRRYTNGSIYQAKYFYSGAPTLPIPPIGHANSAMYWQVLNSGISTGQLLISEIGVQLRPQGAAWDAKDNFRADGPGGTVRPTEPLDVYHPDVPIAAGLYGGNLFAFSRAAALADGSMSTSWRRPGDLKPAPLFAANVFDALALRQGNSRLLLGLLHTAGLAPPRLLDAIDTPHDVPGRRWAVGAIKGWDTKQARVELSMLEIGPGEGYAPVLSDGARVTEGVVVEVLPGTFEPELRVTEDGAVRVVE